MLLLTWVILKKKKNTHTYAPCQVEISLTQPLTICLVDAFSNQPKYSGYSFTNSLNVSPRIEKMNQSPFFWTSAQMQIQLFEYQQLAKNGSVVKTKQRQIRLAVCFLCKGENRCGVDTVRETEGL